MSASDDFKKQLGAQLATALGPDWKFFRSRLELQRRFEAGHHSIVLSGSSQFSPLISVAFYFGVCFAEARRLEKALGFESPAHYHIFYYSTNGPGSMGGLAYDGPARWDVDLTAPPVGLLDQLHQAVIGMAFPFFERFDHPMVARDALVARDPWCLHHVWRSVLLLDVVLNDLDHFAEWRKRLSAFEDAQAAELLARLR